MKEAIKQKLLINEIADIGDPNLLELHQEVLNRKTNQIYSKSKLLWKCRKFIQNSFTLRRTTPHISDKERVGAEWKQNQILVHKSKESKGIYTLYFMLSHSPIILCSRWFLDCFQRIFGSESFSRVRNSKAIKVRYIKPLFFHPFSIKEDLSRQFRKSIVIDGPIVIHTTMTIHGELHSRLSFFWNICTHPDSYWQFMRARTFQSWMSLVRMEISFRAISSQSPFLFCNRFQRSFLHFEHRKIAI